MSNDSKPQRQNPQDESLRPAGPVEESGSPSKTTHMPAVLSHEIPPKDPDVDSEPLAAPTVAAESTTTPDLTQSVTEVGPGQYPGIRRPLATLWWLVQVLAGLAFLLPLLAALAAFPIVSFVALGIMLAAQANVAKTGRLRDGFPLLPIASRIGTIGIMAGLCLLPVVLVSSIAEGQQIIAALSNQNQRSWWIGKIVLQVFVFVVLLTAIANGGSVRAFFWPFRKREHRPGWKTWLVIAAAIALAVAQPAFLLIYLALFFFGAAIRNSRDVIRKLRDGSLVQQINDWSTRLLQLFQPWQHFTMAIKAAAGALCWLILPTLLLGMSTSEPRRNPGPFVMGSVLGGVLMIPVAAWLPLLQCHQATTGRFLAIFEVRTVREIICRAPLRWALSTILLYGLAVPLYLSKVVLPPADAFWLFTPLFILAIYPTRLLMGSVYHAGRNRDTRVTPIVRWPAKVFMIPVLGLYSGILFLLPLISEAGPRAILENHAFLLPVPSGQF